MRTGRSNHRTEVDEELANGVLEGEPCGYRMTLKLRHPNCWMNDVTAETDGKLLVNSVYTDDERVKTHVIAYANTTDVLDKLVTATRTSERTYSVSEIYNQHEYDSTAAPLRKPARTLLVEYDPEDSIHHALVSRGFIPLEPLRMRDGYEYWTVGVDDPRERMQEKLAAVREEKNAEISVRKISTGYSSTESDIDTRTLSDRQREVFELARDRGYYDWPRAVSGGELATELGIAKTTLFEHLRKAEAKLLGAE